MDFLEALTYLKENYAAMIASGQELIGMAHTPNIREGEFFILSLGIIPASDRRYSERSTDENGVCDGFSCCLHGGFIEPNKDKSKDNDVYGFYVENNPKALIKTLPDFAEKISYAIHKPKGVESKLKIAGRLAELVPHVLINDLTTTKSGRKELKALAVSSMLTVDSDTW